MPAPMPYGANTLTGGVEVLPWSSRRGRVESLGFSSQQSEKHRYYFFVRRGKGQCQNSLNLIPRVLPAIPSGEEHFPKKIRKKSVG